MNEVNLVGRLANTPKFKEFENDVKLATIPLALNSYNFKKGERFVTYVFVKFWGKRAEIMSKVPKGTLISVTGHLSTSKFERDGKMQYMTYVTADKFDFLEKKRIVNNTIDVIQDVLVSKSSEDPNSNAPAPNESSSDQELDDYYNIFFERAIEDVTPEPPINDDELMF